MIERISTVEDGFAYFESFMNLERSGFAPREYRLDRMQRLLDDFDNPQLAYRTIHVAGSKGKGSVSAFIASILAADGHTVGLYASPHVSSYRERVRVLTGDDAGCPVDNLADQILIEQFERVRQYVVRITGTTPEAELPTTFELLTLFAFIVYQAAGCDVAVIEVGLGGRLDATNLVRPVAGVITPIETEHTDYLGTTLTRIAHEKAGIIKPGMKLFVAPQHPEARAEIARVAAERSVPVDFVSPHDQMRSLSVDIGGTNLILRDGGDVNLPVHLRLLGRFQAENAMLAVRTLEGIDPDLSIGSIDRGLRSAWLPGRLEVVERDPIVIVDGAHTVRSIEVLVQTVRELGVPVHERVLVFGAVTGKDHRPMVELLAPEFARIVVARPGTFKKSDTGALYALCREYHEECVLRDEIGDAVATARSSSPRLIVVTGSLYLAGDARDYLLGVTAGRAVAEGCP